MLGFNGGLIGTTRNLADTTLPGGIWMPSEAAYVRTNAGDDVDTLFYNVSLLLPFDGNNGSTTYTDAGPNGFALTGTAGASISTAQSRYGGSSLLLSGSNSCLTGPVSSAFTITGDFTVEFDIRSISSGFQNILHVHAGSSNGLHIYQNGTSLLIDNGLAADWTSSAGVLAANTWATIAICKSGSTLYVFANGTLLTSRTAQSYGTPDRINIGRFQGGGVPDGNFYMDNFRLTRGIARYTATYTPSTSAFLTTGPRDTNLANVSLLLSLEGANNSTTFTDLSRNAFTVTRVGTNSISTGDSEFGRGALLLTNNGSYLQTPANSAFQIGTGDFTIEAWVKWISGSNNGLFTFGGVSSGLALATYNGQWTLTTSGAGGQSVGAVLATKHHIAITRNGTAMRFFINGTQTGTFTDAANLADNQLKLGYYYDPNYGLNGRVSWFRFTKGVARYTSTFVPPFAYPVT